MDSSALSPGRTRLAAWLPALAVIAGAAIRTVTLPYKSLWLDEVVTLRLAQGSLGEILAAHADPHPPLYYLLLHFWIGLGQSEAVLRLPSLLAGILAIPLLYWVVVAWGGRRSATAAAWLLALAPLHVWYSQETRMYALVCTLGLLATLLFILAARQGRWPAWIGWALVMLAGLYTDYSMFFVLAGHLVFYPFCLAEPGGRPRPAPAWSGPLALLAILGLYAPQARSALLPIIAGGQESWGDLYLLPAALLRGLGLAISPAQLHSLVTAASVALLVLALVLALWWLPARPWRRWRRQLPLAAAAVVVYLLILAASAVSRAWGIKRQLLVLLPYVLAACAAGLATQRRRTQLVLALAVITLPFTGYALLGQEQEGWRAAARLVGREAQPADLLAFEAGFNQQAFDYYDQGTLPRQGVTPADVTGELPRLAAGHERTWLILCAEQIADPDEAVQTWFDRNLDLQETHAFGRVRIRLYTRR